MPGTKTTSSRPDGVEPGTIWLKTILKGWDLWIGLAVGAGLGLYSWCVGSLRGQSSHFWPLVVLCVTLALGVWLAERWLADGLRSSPYGELIGIADPNYTALTAPYFVVEVVGLFAAVFAAVSAFVIDGLAEPSALAVVHGVNAWLITWTVLGALSIFITTNRHIRRRAEVENMRRQHDSGRRPRWDPPPSDDPEQ